MSYRTQGFDNFTIMAQVTESDLERLAKNDAREQFDEESMRITLLGAKVLMPLALEGRRHSNTRNTMDTHPELHSRLVVTDAQSTDGWLRENRNDEVAVASDTIYRGPGVDPEVLSYPTAETHEVDYKVKAVGRIGLHFSPGSYTVLEGRPFEIQQRPNGAYVMTAPPLQG